MIQKSREMKDGLLSDAIQNLYHRNESKDQNTHKIINDSVIWRSRKSKNIVRINMHIFYWYSLVLSVIFFLSDLI